jgi:hypothetical protein
VSAAGGIAREGDPLPNPAARFITAGVRAYVAEAGPPTEPITIIAVSGKTRIEHVVSPEEAQRLLEPPALPPWVKGALKRVYDALDFVEEKCPKRVARDAGWRRLTGTVYSYLQRLREANLVRVGPRGGYLRSSALVLVSVLGIL